MTVGRKIILAVLAVLCAFGIIAVAVISWDHYDSNDYDRQITLGKRYYSAGDYEKAMARFKRAISLRPNDDAGYAGLSQVYTLRGDNITAYNILRLGIERTGSEVLNLQIGTISLENRKEETIYKLPTELNRHILQLLKTKTFNEYRLDNNDISGTVTGDGDCVVEVSSPAGELIFAATNVDRITGTPDSDSIPRYVSMENVMEVFGGAEEVTLADLQEMGADPVSMYDDKDHGKVVFFTIEDCEFTVSCQDDGSFKSYAWNQIKLPEIAKGDKDDGELDEGNNREWQITGKVVNAVTGDGVSGASLRFQDMNSGSSEVPGAITDGFGVYEVALAEGSYRVEVSCDGFTPEEFTIRVDAGSSMTVDPFVISPVLAEGQIRIVLEWGSFPRDLDSYLSGRLDNGASVSTYYGSPTSFAGGNLSAELDVDDRDGYGPETTTIYDINGTFTFWVEDFTTTGTMSDSGATVKIYTPQSISPIVINICSGCDNRWNVCEIDHGNVTVINQP